VNAASPAKVNLSQRIVGETAMNRNILVIIVLVLLCLWSRAENTNEQYRFWAPGSTDIAVAEAVARDFIWKTLSDQQRTNEFEITVSMTNSTIQIHDPRPETPETFTIHSIPFSRYARRYAGWYRQGIRVLNISYYDTVHFPDWKNIAGVSGGFPHYFTVTIDMEKKAIYSTHHSSM
jgi:hypothetical protein